MKRMRMVMGLCLVAVLGMSAFGVVSASAAAPEFGRCLKVVKPVKGKFSDAKCTKAAVAGKEGFEWSPGPGPNNKYTTVIKPLTKATLESTNKETISCTGQTSSGEFDLGNPKKTRKNISTFTNCEFVTFGVKCNSPGHAVGELVTNPFETELGIITKSSEGPIKNKLGNDLKPETGNEFIKFECAKIPVGVTGSLIVPVKSNTFTNKETLKFTQSKGHQKPEKFENEPKDTLTTTSTSGTFQSGQTITVIQTDEEKIEANSVV